MGIQINLKEVFDKIVALSFAKIYANLKFTEQDALLAYGFFKGVDEVLKIFFSKKELEELLAKYKSLERINLHRWSDLDRLESDLSKWRTNMVAEGMQETKRMKSMMGNIQGQEKLVKLMTSMLKDWKPTDGTKS